MFQEFEETQILKLSGVQQSVQLPWAYFENVASLIMNLLQMHFYKPSLTFLILKKTSNAKYNVDVVYFKQKKT